MVLVDPQVNNSQLILVSGPSRGGKSRWAESLLANDPFVIYVATGMKRDDDPAWVERLRIHRERRPSHWSLLEPGPDLIQSLQTTEPRQSVLVDSLGGFVATHLDMDGPAWTKHSDNLITTLAHLSSKCIVVIEETGWGVVPATQIGGLFRDRLGQLAQQLDQIADLSWLVLQGRAVDLRAISHPVP
jgi:adenosylcobinamide kinase/adenosylcobinamide-phosphate guanylyltransferase